MKRTLDFSGVTGYDFSLKGPDVVLELFQGDTLTEIRIKAASSSELRKPPPASSKVVSSGRTAVLPSKSSSSVAVQPVKAKRTAPARMTEEQVKEIRANWDQTVKACGTKNAAAERLAQVYHCSAKNIYAIIYKYSWAHV